MLKMVNLTYLIGTWLNLKCGKYKISKTYSECKWSHKCKTSQ